MGVVQGTHSHVSVRAAGDEVQERCCRREQLLNFPQPSFDRGFVFPSCLVLWIIVLRITLISVSNPFNQQRDFE